MGDENDSGVIFIFVQGVVWVGMEREVVGEEVENRPNLEAYISTIQLVFSLHTLNEYVSKTVFSCDRVHC